MTLTIEEAEEAAGAIGLLGAGFTLLWMLSNLGEANTAQMLSGFENVVTSVVVTPFGLIVLLLILSAVYSEFSDF